MASLCTVPMATGEFEDNVVDVIILDCFVVFACLFDLFFILILIFRITSANLRRGMIYFIHFLQMPLLSKM